MAEWVQVALVFSAMLVGSVLLGNWIAKKRN